MATEPDNGLESSCASVNLGGEVKKGSEGESKVSNEYAAIFDPVRMLKHAIEQF